MARQSRHCNTRWNRALRLQNYLLKRREAFGEKSKMSLSLKTYPAPHEAELSGDYSLLVNGEKVCVYHAGTGTMHGRDKRHTPRPAFVRECARKPHACPLRKTRSWTLPCTSGSLRTKPLPIRRISMCCSSRPGFAMRAGSPGGSAPGRGLAGDPAEELREIERIAKAEALRDSRNGNVRVAK